MSTIIIDDKAEDGLVNLRDVELMSVVRFGDGDTALVLSHEERYTLLMWDGADVPARLSTDRAPAIHVISDNVVVTVKPL